MKPAPIHLLNYRFHQLGGKFHKHRNPFKLPIWHEPSLDYSPS